MSPQVKTSLVSRIFVFFVLTLLTITIFKTGFVLSTTQSSDEVRNLDSRVPGHLPIKIKIKKEKEKAFKDLKNEHWARDFELEVKNTGDKPIYYLSLVVLLPDVVMPDGNPYGFGLRYGRLDFERTIGTIPTPEDLPIHPGDTYVFRLPNFKIEGWENWVTREKLPPPKRIQVLFDYLSFGDDTGFESPGGKVLDRKRQRSI